MARKKRLLTETEKKLNRLYRKWVKTQDPAVFKEWSDLRASYVLTAEGVEWLRATNMESVFSRDAKVAERALRNLFLIQVAGSVVAGREYVASPSVASLARFEASPLMLVLKEQSLSEFRDTYFDGEVVGSMSGEEYARFVRLYDVLSLAYRSLLEDETLPDVVRLKIEGKVADLRKIYVAVETAV